MAQEYAGGSMLDKMRQLAAAYVPEWRFDPDNPDSGAALALLTQSMLAESASRFDHVLHKHKIQYLNLFDRLKEEPVESARSYVRFYPVPGIDEPVFIPRGSQLLANSRSGKHRVTFETAYGITAVGAELEALFATDKDGDAIVEVLSSRTGGTAEKCLFTAFGTDLDNQSEHMLLLGYDDLLDGLDSLRLQVEVQVLSEEEQEPVMAALLSPAVRFVLLGREETVAFDKAEREGENQIVLTRAQYTPEKTELAAGERYVLGIVADKLCQVELSGLRIRLSGREIVPDDVSCNGISQNPHRFLPFGEPMDIYAECVLESIQVFARKGARVEIKFDLDFQVLEQLLPEIEEDPDYKLVMKRPRSQPKPTVVDVKADYVLFEYLTATGWKRLIREEHLSVLFNGSARGAMTVAFTVPADILPPEQADGQGRLRLRLIRAGNLYRIPCRQYCPVISNLRLSYHYDEAPVLPDYACTRNNFEVVDVTAQLRRGRSISLFYNKEARQPAMYLGFSSSCWGTPLSLYWRIENNADYQVDFTAEYLSPAGFVPLKLVDNTGGMLYSETMLLVVPPDIQRRSLFGKELYWIRLLCHNRTSRLYDLPVVSGIYTNMAKVENVSTRTEYFYVDDVDRALDITLAEQNLLKASVYVNEEGNGTEDENWVLWHKAQHRMERGRVYNIDLAAGEIRFEKGVFASFPPAGKGPDIKVEYQGYQGSEANVDAYAINTMNTAIRYISRVENPIPAYGGYDGYNEETSQAIIANMLRTRGRAVTGQDYFDIISQISYGVKRIKCVSGVNPQGERDDNLLTIAVLTLEYEKGGHIFSAVKDAIRQKLTECSGIIPLGKQLVLSQPHFIQIFTRLWLECEKMENAYDLQKACGESVRTFIDPLTGGFEGTGWEIGVLPNRQQLLAYLKIRHPDVVVGRIVMTARFGDREFAVEDDIYRQVNNPFAMAVNGDHVVYVELSGGM
ncbi:hypothetical protein LJC63_00695 [Ruminococcaceae bacterium OttesenSCG-928-L11]|nr:hypothetical protein [Ruminococcaceae bacterium OttesenSCG-928-L11]